MSAQGRAEYLQVNEDRVKALTDMGFGEAEAAEALWRTRSVTKAAELLADADSSSAVQPRKAVPIGSAPSGSLRKGVSEPAPSQAPAAAATYSPGDEVEVKSKARGWVPGRVDEAKRNANNELKIYVSFPSESLQALWLSADARFVRPRRNPAVRSSSSNLSVPQSRDSQQRSGSGLSDLDIEEVQTPPPRSSSPSSSAVATASSLSSSAPPPLAPVPRAGARAGGAEQDDDPPAAVQRGPSASPSKPLEPPQGLAELPQLVVGTFVDCRDNVGKWLEAEIIKRVESDVLVHFLRWESKWDEWIDAERERFRFAPFHYYSAGSEADGGGYNKGDSVFVFPPNVTPRRWIQGTVRKKDGAQVQVQWTADGRTFQYWFHAESDELAGEEGPKDPPELDRSADGKWFRGQYIEVLDTVGKWLPAVILKVSTSRLYLHYENWSSRWDEWLHLQRDAHRMRPLGVALAPTSEEVMRKEQEGKFRKQLFDDHGFRIVDCDKDGNCLFRSVAHQIYNDPDRHAEVRKRCYDHMEQHRDFFSMYITEDFDAYLARQRKPNEWGDHVEVVALRELFNKNVEVYDKDCVRTPKPLGLVNVDYQLPVIRLSYHGSNHYNSVVDPSHPPPLGDGSDAPVSLLRLRLRETDAHAAAAGGAGGAGGASSASAAPPRSGSIGAAGTASPQGSARGDEAGGGFSRNRFLSRDLMRPRYLGSASLDEADFDAVWKQHDVTGSHVVPTSQAPNLVMGLLRALYEKKKAAYREKQPELEALAKRFDDAKTDVSDQSVRLVQSVGDRGNLRRADTLRYVMGNLSPDMEWAFGKE